MLAIIPGQPDATRLQNVAARNQRDESSIDHVSGGVWAVPVAYRGGGHPPDCFRRLAAPRASAASPSAAFSHHSPCALDLKPTVVSPIPPPSGDSGRPNFGTLHVTARVLNGNRFPIPKAGLLIGRESAKYNIVISDDAVSKEHAWVVPLDHEVIVIDRGSSNGTYVNSTDSPRVNKVALKDGDPCCPGRKCGAYIPGF